ncbi:MAG: retroviral-like aspartic protease family protein, partial [Candidatus Thiodiazotropha taylori]|nr:retroviral-like aspartic protease family protein [Candidatus Thiodiazotropha taylori]
MYFTIDTGASQTILSKRIYERIPINSRPKLNESVNNITCAGGTILKEHGKAIFDLQLGNLRLTKELIVADIGDEGLLGADIMQEDNEGPGDLLLSRGILRLRGVDIEILRVGKDCRVRKVTAADHYTVPGYCEQVIDVFIERFPEDHHTRNKDVLVEACEGFNTRYPLVMASSVVDMDSGPTQQVRLLNPSSDPVLIYQDSVIGTAERYDDLHVLIQSEDPSQTENNNAVRRVQLMSAKAEGDISRTAIHSTQSKLPQHLEDLCSQACHDRTQQEREVITELLIKHENVFSRHEFDLGRTSPSLGVHIIDTGNAKPVRCPPRRVPLAFADEERNVIETMEKQGIIRKSRSCWSSPLVLVRKKDGKVRPCVDYRAVNKVTQMDNFPIPRTRDCLDAVAGASLFSTFDVTSSYHQIPVRNIDVAKTAFITKYGLYEHCTMPMGMKNSSATFQRIMETVLHGLNWLTCLIYLDDIVVFARTFQEHADRVDAVLSRIEAAGLKLKPNKCHLFQREVHFLGHIISGSGVLPSPDNVAKIMQFAAPKNATQARALIGLGSYYRRHIKGYSNMMRPIIDLTKKGKEFLWTKQCEEALEKLKEALVSPPIMAYPLDKGEYFLDCDASDYAIGGVLSQIQGGEEKVISYGSKMLNKAERNYCVTDKELLAVRYFIEYYRQYLLGRKFTVRTDHKALSFLFSFKEPRGRLARYLEILSAYDFVIEYRRAGGHANADGMSRCVSPWNCQCNEVDMLEPLKCWPCKKCEKRALDMKSSLLMGCFKKSNETRY